LPVLRQLGALPLETCLRGGELLLELGQARRLLDVAALELLDLRARAQELVARAVALVGAAPQLPFELGDLGAQALLERLPGLLALLELLGERRQLSLRLAELAP